MSSQIAACAEMLWHCLVELTRLRPCRARTHGRHLHQSEPLPEGWLTDANGFETLLASARETAKVGTRLGVQRLYLHGTRVGDIGIPIPKIGPFAPGIEQRARDTLDRICDLIEAEEEDFTLENLNLIDHPGCPFGSAANFVALVSAVNRPQLRMKLDLHADRRGRPDLLASGRSAMDRRGARGR